MIGKTVSLLPREIVLNSIKRIGIFANSTTSQIKFKVSGNEIEKRS